MLKDNLYKILQSDHGEGNIKATLEIDKDNAIFAGHFPGKPVLPGACMLQMVKEVLEIVLNRRLRLNKAGQIKFLGLTDPRINTILELDLTYKNNGISDITVTASLTASSTVCFKFKGEFVVV